MNCLAEATKAGEREGTQIFGSARRRGGKGGGVAGGGGARRV